MTFLPHNDRLLRACTDWQLRPNGADPLAVNEHTDKEWDRRVLTTLSSVSGALRPLCQELGGRLVRFQGYDDRFAAALARAASEASTPGSLAQEWTRATRCGSRNCMRIW